MLSSVQSSWWRWSGVTAALLLVTCVDPIDMERQTFDRGTLGEEVYKQLERDLPRTADNPAEKTASLQAERDGLIWSIDTIMPDAEIDGFEELALRLLPYWDDNSLPDLLRKLAFVYEDISNSSQVLEAWVRSDDVRAGLTSEAADPDLLPRLLTYPRVRELTDFTLDLLLDNDGLGPNGEAASEESDFITRLLESLRDFFAEPDDPTDPYRNVAIVADLVMATDHRFGQLDSTSPMLVVAPDNRGVPLVARLDDGRLPLPFVDGDGDGLADVDQQGAFVDTNGTSFTIQAFGVPTDVVELPNGTRVGYDAQGRAFLPNGQSPFEIVDLNDTALGYLLRRTPELIERGVLVDLFVALEGLLGEPATGGEYPQFSTATPLLDLVDAAFQIGDYPGVASLTELGSILMSDYEATVASFLWVSDHNADINDSYNAELAPDNAFVDDLLPYFYEIAQHEGLLDEVLTVLQDPMMDLLMVAMIDMQSHYNPRISPAVDGAYEIGAAACAENYEVGTRARFDCFRSLDRVEIFAGEVDHTRPEGADNTSLNQRVLHLIYDGSGVPFDMVILELTAGGVDLTGLVEEIGALLTIPDVVAAFFDSISGNFCLEDTINVERFQEENLLGAIISLADVFGVDTSNENLAEMVTSIVVLLSDGLGVHLDECPTPEQLIRFFNLPVLELDMGPVHTVLLDPLDSEGYVFANHMADSLWASEATGMLDGLYPLFKVFSDRGLSPLLGRLIKAFYRHYPEPNATYRHADGTRTDFAYSGIRRYEPALNEIFEEGYLIDLGAEFAAVVQAIELEDDVYAPSLLEDVIDFALDESAGVQDRHGSTTATRGDGATTPMTRFYLLIEAMDAIDDLLAGNPEADEAWERASDELVDLMFDTVDAGPGRGAFEDRGSAGLATVATLQLTNHLRRHLEAGDLSQLLRQDYPDYVEDIITSRALVAAVELFRVVRANPDDQALFDDFLTYLTAPNEDNTRTATALIYEFLMNGVDQVGYMKVAAFMSNLVDPDRRFAVEHTADLPLVAHGAAVLRNILAVDPESLGIELLQRGLVAPEGGESPLAVLGRVIRQIHRVEPGVEQAMTVQDKAQLYTVLHEFIRDDFRGVERLIDLIQNRAGE